MKLLPRALLLLCCLAGNPVSANDDLPVLGDPTSALMSADQEYRLGRAWLRQLRGQTSIMSDPLIQEYVESLVYKLASFSDLKEPELDIVVINSREINAFAVPGGVIGLNAGLFLNAEDESEVGGVVAHEIAHVSQRHFARRYLDAKKVNTAVLAAMLASLAVAIAGEGEAGMAGMAATQAGAIQAQLAYSRQNEREADRVGMQTLASAGMDPDAMPRFFERMLNEQQFAGDPLEFLLTHPVTESRIADSRARARNLPSPPMSISPHYLLVQARLRAAFIQGDDQAIAYFERYRNERSALALQAARYGLALSHLRANQYDLARSLMEQLADQYPDELWFRLGLVEVAVDEENYPRAIEEAKRVLKVSPDDYAASILLSKAYLRSKQPAMALPVLSPLLNKRPSDPHIWDLVADAYGNSGDRVRALHARAETHFLRGNSGKALQQMEYALKGAEDDFALYSKLSGRMKDMQRLSEEEF
ncbi:M48 family metalloprotease [Alcanivorax sediminis]|nr:M48 family metalloprotease [Alcanivorax sediminis]